MPEPLPEPGPRTWTSGHRPVSRHARTRRLRAGLWALLCGALWPVADAAAASPPLATREEYAACLDAQDAIDRRKASITQAVDELQALAQRMRAADEDLSAQVKRHTPRTNAELASYNAAVDRRNAAARQFNARNDALQKATEALNDQVFKANEQCGAMVIASDVKAEVDEARRARSRQ